tara:strand:+ start:1665 stop:1922 length:258 start_codon:yes stop_codon:yes gene_type:complete
MGSPAYKPKIDSESEKAEIEAYTARQQELHDSLLVSRDYHRLTFFHKFVIISLLLSTVLFAVLLFFTYVPGLKEPIFEILSKILG